jgi:hypothetical protein
MLLGVAAAGALIWYAGRFNASTEHDYWISLGLVSAAGVVFGLGLLVFDANLAMMIVAIVATLVVVWIALASQPTHGHVTNWSNSLGIGSVVRDLGMHVTVLGFAAGVAVATVIGAFRRSAAPVEAVDRPAAAPVTTTTPATDGVPAEREPSLSS